MHFYFCNVTQCGQGLKQEWYQSLGIKWVPLYSSTGVNFLCYMTTQLKKKRHVIKSSQILVLLEILALYFWGYAVNLFRQMQHCYINFINLQDLLCFWTFQQFKENYSIFFILPLPHFLFLKKTIKKTTNSLWTWLFILFILLFF